MVRLKVMGPIFAGLICVSLLTLNIPVRAVIDYTPYPSAANSEFWRLVGGTRWVNVGSAYGSQVVNDATYSGLVSTTGTDNVIIKTNIFNNALGDPFLATGGYPPADNATIIHVEVTAIVIPADPAFYPGYSGWTPNCRISFTWNNYGTVYQSAAVPSFSFATVHAAGLDTPPTVIASGLFFYTGQCRLAWDVTNFTSWTPAKLKSSNLWVELQTIVMPAYELSFVDYVGLNYAWLAPGETGVWCNTHNTTPIPETPTIIPPFSIDTNGLLGMIGFFGMIALPGAAVAIGRNSENRMRVAALAFVWFFILFALFMYSLG